MRQYSKPTLVTLCCLAAALVLPVRADELAQKGRDIFTKNQHAVVTVEMVQKMSSSAGGRSSNPSESKVDVTGTVIDPSGLAVLALSACDPVEMYQRMMPEEYSKYETEITDVKILLDDGSEIPAEIVLRDKDLDLVFIRPKTRPAAAMAAVDFAKSSPALLLDEVITLNRLNRAASRAYSASVERISAIVQKPRTLYIPDSTETATGLGSPVFSLDGNVVGLVVMRAVAVQGGGRSNVRDGMTTVILPAEDILKGAKQAPEAKGDSADKEAPKDTKPSAGEK